MADVVSKIVVYVVTGKVKHEKGKCRQEYPNYACVVIKFVKLERMQYYDWSYRSFLESQTLFLS